MLLLVSRQYNTLLGYTVVCVVYYGILILFILTYIDMLFKPCIVDIDECSTDMCMAEATCVNTDGSYRCECNPGLTLRLELCVGK